jgi:hypothetical protein
VDENGFNSPILREVEFRARIRQFGEGFSDYRLRFSPLNPFEKAANKNYKNILSNQISTEYLMNLEEVLLRRYEVMIDHRNLSMQKEILDGNIKFYNNLLSLYQSQTELSSVKDYISLDKSLLESSLELEKIKNELYQLEELIRDTYPYSGSISWVNHEFVEISHIKEWLAQQRTLDLNNNLYLLNEQQKELVTDAEYRIKKQESFSNIGYVQAEYRNDPGNQFQENMGMQIGLSLPIVNPDKPDLERRKLEMLEDTQDFELEKKNLERYIKFAQLDLESQIRRYELIAKKSAIYTDQTFFAKIGANTIDTMLELQEFKAELARLKTTLSATIYKSYLNLLSYDAQLSKEPYLNYLAKDQTSFTLDESETILK